MITNVLTYFENASQHCPDRILFSDQKQRLTYREAWDAVVRMGERLHTLIGRQNCPVAVSIRHTVTDLLAFFSVVYSGNFYVPVDLSLPAARVERMLSVIEPEAVILMEEPRNKAALDHYRIITRDMLSEPANSFDSPWKAGKDTDLLYVIFTSGSTGEPKGVSISHRSVIDMAEQFQAVFQFEDGTVFGNQAPFDFDVSVKDIFLSLKVGGTVEILEKKLFSFPKLLIERMNERKVDTIVWAVPALKIIAAVETFSVVRPLYLKNIMFSGEVMPVKTLQYWMQELSNARFVNLYGPTEITCNCTYHILDPDEDLKHGVPIGQAFPNCSVFLLDGDQRLDEEGPIGEICVTGSCLSLGYYRRPDITAASFPQNPLCTAYREPMYRTGDLGWLQHGKLFYAGRKDTQIKHMGHRIEMNEIELCANAADGVSVSACIYDKNALRLVLFYQGSCDAAKLSAHLRKQLPKYMLPNELHQVDVFPMTRTGKIDRNQLKSLLMGETNHG